MGVEVSSPLKLLSAMGLCWFNDLITVRVGVEVSSPLKLIGDGRLVLFNQRVRVGVEVSSPLKRVAIVVVVPPEP